MADLFQRTKALATSPNRIAFMWALRGTIATGLPLLGLPLLGFDLASHFVTLGALNTSMVDVGGPYRSRLEAMALNSLLAPLSLLAGSFVQETWWLAAPLIFVIAIGSGLARAIGPAGTPLGFFIGIGFLVGTNLPGTGPIGFEAAALYGAGGFWTILVALAFWRLRPFKRLEQEVAAVWEAAAALVFAMRTLDVMPESMERRHRHERLLARRHQGLREAVERARATLGNVRAEVAGPGTTMAQLMILVRAASRIAAAAVMLAELRQHEARYRERGSGFVLIDAAAMELETACRAVAASLASGRRQLSLAGVRARLKESIAAFGETDPEVMAYAQAMRNLENADEAMGVLLGAEHRYLGLLPPLARINPPGHAFRAIRAQLSTKSAIFRHALRVATAVAIATAIVIGSALRHGIWLPMATLVVLQPEFGGTLARALQRTAGTVAGAVIAGLLLATLHGSFALNLVLMVLLFAAFFVQRRRYALGVTFLTPLIVLLIATSVGDPWLDTLDRILATAAGAALALAAGYVLWPQWEHQRLPDLLARAIRANRAYMARILQALTRRETQPAELGELRRQAEIATGNAEAGFQRLLGEPRTKRGGLGGAFVLVTYVQRLERHLIALAAQIGCVELPAADAAALSGLLEAAQEAVAAAVAPGVEPAPCPPFDVPLGRLRKVLETDEPTGAGSTTAYLLGRITSDTTSLHAAAARGEAADAPRERPASAPEPR